MEGWVKTKRIIFIVYWGTDSPYKDSLFSLNKEVQNLPVTKLWVLDPSFIKGGTDHPLFFLSLYKDFF